VFSSITVTEQLASINRRNVMQKIYRFVLLLTLGSWLAACGSGGSGDGSGEGASLPPAASNVTLTPQAIKTLRFTWSDVSGETEYRLLENPDGISGFTQVASIAADAAQHDFVVSLPKRINAQYILQSCNAGGCTDSTVVSVSGALTAAIGYAKASNTGVADAFGTSLALSDDGNTLAVGASGEDSNATGIGGNQNDNSASGGGAVYVFTRTGTFWSQQAYIKASNTEAGDRFGSSLDLSADGNTLAVGADDESSNAIGIGGNQSNNSASGSGAVYVFTRTGSIWSQQAYVKASNTGVGDQFGTSLALSDDGNTLAVGADDEDSIAIGIDGNQGDNTASESGAVYVFTRVGTFWSQQAYVKASNTGASDFFGSSLGLSADGKTLAVGAVGEASSAIGIGGDQSDNSASFSGAVYVFTLAGNTWSQQAYVKASNTGASDFFGSLALSADGNTLAVGAFGEDSNAIGIGGDQGNNIAGNSGAIYVFTRTGAFWTQQAYIKASNTGANDGFGSSLALSDDGKTLAVAPSGEASNAIGIDGDQSDNSASFSGAVYVFTLAGNTWSQQAYVKASNTGANDGFGTSLALSADGNTLAVGATGEASNAIGIGGDQNDNSTSFSGAVYLY
jgi:hypothetical protein